jgi:hypothetical protein
MFDVNFFEKFSAENCGRTNNATGWVLDTSLSAGKGRKIAQETRKGIETRISLCCILI